MRSFCRIILVSCILPALGFALARPGYFVFSNFALAVEDINQKILDLRKQVEELEKQAEQYRGTVAQKQKEAATLQNEIKKLNNQILNLETQILVTGKKIDGAKLEIGDISDKIFYTQEDITKKQKTVAEIISLINRRDKESLLAVLVKNRSLSDFFNQIHYDQSIQKQLVSLLSELKSTKNILESERNQLDLKKQELEKLNQTQKGKKIALDGTKYNKDLILSKTKGQEAAYQKLLSDVERKKAEFFSELQKLENEAVERGEYILRVKSTIPPRSKIFQWPEDDYILTQSYGSTPFSRRGAYGGAPHNGIDMTSGYGTAIKSIGGGKILVSGTNDGWGNWVAILHDNGLVSLYSHMRASSGIANGTPINKGDIIGYEGTTGNVTGSHLHLSLYYEFFTFINPKNGQIYFNYFEGTINPLNYLE